MTNISGDVNSKFLKGVIVYDANTSNHVLKLCVLWITQWYWLSL